MVPGTTTGPFYLTMQVGAEAEAHKLGIRLIWEGGTAATPESQIPVVQALLARKPNALIIAPDDATALIPPLEQYRSAHIPILTVDTTITKTSLLVSRITSDSYQGGETAADTIGTMAHGRGAVVVISVAPGITTTDLRTAGFIAEIHRRFPKMQVLSTEYANDSVSTAANDVQELLLAHPNLVGVFGNNSFAAQGAGSGVVAAHKQGKVFVVGFDAPPVEVALLKSGVIDALVIQKPADEATIALQYAVDYLEGNRTKIKRSVQIANVVATRANMNTPAIEHYFYLASS
jgi:ribose transport system substrate-binding protein